MPKKITRIRLVGQHWAWLNALVALGAWGIVIGFFTPVSYNILYQQPFIGIWSVVTVIGVAIAITGVLWSVSRSAVRRTLAVSVELIGLCFAAVGPVLFFLAQVFLFTTPTPDGSTRYALAFFAYFALSMLIYRIVVLLPRFNKEAHDGTKDV